MADEFGDRQESGESVIGKDVKGLTRRQFLKRFGAGVVLAGTGSLLESGCGVEGDMSESELAVERSPSGIGRFFEDIEGFSEEKLEECRLSLEGFGVKFESSLEKLGVSQESWVDAVGFTMESLSRMRQGYGHIYDWSGVAAENVRTKYKADFYELGSAVWAVMRVGEVFDTNPGMLEKLVQDYVEGGFRNESTDSGDLILGEEILEINALWTGQVWRDGESSTAEGVGRVSPVIELLSGVRYWDNMSEKQGWNIQKQGGFPGLLRIVENWMPEYGSRVGDYMLSHIQYDENTTSSKGKLRPEKGRFERGEDITAEEIGRIVEDYGLDRAFGRMIFINDESGGFVARSLNNRDLQINLEEFEVDENTGKWKKVTQAEGEHIVIHEITHVLDDMCRWVDEPMAVELRVVRESILEQLRPYGDMERLAMVGEKAWSEVRQDLNVTPERLMWYAASLIPGGIQDNLNVDRWGSERTDLGWLVEKSLVAMGQDGADEIVDRGWVLRHCVKGDGRIYSGLSDYLENVDSSNMSEFERKIVEFAKVKASKFDLVIQAGKDWGLEEHDADFWYQQMIAKVVPMTLVVLVSSEQEVVNRTMNGETKMRQHEYELLKNRVDMVKKMADVELLAEVVATALRDDRVGLDKAKQPVGVDWEKVVVTVKDWVERLKSEGLAREDGVEQVGMT